MSSKIRMTRKGNLKVDGVKYHATPSGGCNGCVLLTVPCDGAVCGGGTRTDREEYKHKCSVIFVKREALPPPPTS